MFGALVFNALVFKVLGVAGSRIVDLVAADEAERDQRWDAQRCRRDEDAPLPI
jgi:hypothetical protein